MSAEPSAGPGRLSGRDDPTQIAPHVGYQDARSRRQISLYITHAVDTADRNRRNLQRWNRHLTWHWYEREPGQWLPARKPRGVRR